MSHLKKKKKSNKLEPESNFLCTGVPLKFKFKYITDIY